MDDGRIEIERLVELHRRAQEERFDRLIRLGRSSEVVGDLEAFVAREPLRERSRSVLMDALAAAGRRADALRVFDDYRRRLADELGVSPSPELRAQHEALLAEDDREAAPGARVDVDPRIPTRSDRSWPWPLLPVRRAGAPPWPACPARRPRSSVGATSSRMSRAWWRRPG